MNKFKFPAYLKLDRNGVEVLHNVSKRSLPKSVALKVTKNGRFSVMGNNKFRLTLTSENLPTIINELCDYAEYFALLRNLNIY